MKQFGYSLFVIALLLCCLQAHPVAFKALKSAHAHRTKFNSKPDFSHFNMSRINETATKLNIRMIPHTHDDIGWLKTVDQYYVDSEKQITNQGVQYIMDSVFPVLNMDASKKFIYVEMGFFERWWNEQEDYMKNVVKKLVSAGQLEFINGGYCMNDEAAVYYEDSIDQMTIGHQFLLQTFNAIPQVGWHIDPFGHASAQAALFAQMGFKAFYFARIDYQDKQKRKDGSGLEMVWIPETSQGIENAMFTHVNYQHYSNPPGFNFDIIGDDNPIQDNIELEGYDVPNRADQFVAWFRQMQTQYKSSDLMHTAGDDFHYMAAHMNFKNYDKLFKYIRNTSGYNVNVFYNTPTEYLSAIYPQGITYPTKTDDFFPYADGDNAYWTGYFTSRVAYKGLVRRSGEFLQAIRKLASQAIWDKSSQYLLNNFITVDKSIYKLEDAMGMGQHHDAVTGTEKQAVAEDYKLHMARGLDAAKQGVLYPYLQERIQADLGISNLQFDICNLNTSSVFCGVTYNSMKNNSSSVLLSIYNSGKARNSTIRVKVPSGFVQVKDTTGNLLPTDIICANATDTTDCDLFFTNSFSGFGLSYFYLVSTTTSNQVTAQTYSAGKTIQINPSQSLILNDMLNFGLNYCTDSSQSNCYKTNFNIKYNYYEGYQAGGQQSGAYIFRPSEKTKNGALSYATPQKVSIYQGKNLVQIHVESGKVISNLRIYNDIATGLELQSFVDSIDTSDGQGKEVILVVTTPSIQNSNTFYTDSMGMELQKRVINYRPTWDLKVTQPIAGNYYPVQSTILIKDTTTSESLAVIPDRSQGGASINQGQVELMIHRRLNNDDGRGVGEALNEKDWDLKGMRQWVTHTLVFNKPGFIQTSHREVQLNRDTANIVVLAQTSKTPFFKQEAPKSSGFTQISGSIKLMTRPMGTNKFLLRFQNMDETTSQDVSTQVFSNSNYAKSTVTEMSLTANQSKRDMIAKRFNWNGLKLNDPSFAKTDYLTSDHFTLRPLEIRTFVVQFESAAAKKIGFMEI